MSRLSIPPLRRAAQRRDADGALAPDGDEWLARATRLLARALRESEVCAPDGIRAKVLEIARAGYDESLCRRPTAPTLSGAGIYARNLRAWGPDLGEPATRERFLAIVDQTLGEISSGA